MNKIVIVCLSLLLMGCSISEENSEEANETAVEKQENKLTGTFMLKAEPGYIRPDNEEDASVYIINTNNNTVHIEGKGRSFTREDRELMDEGLSGEELEEIFGKMEVEEPKHDLTYLKATKDKIILEYEDERLEFTALSESYFESETEIRYQILENTTVSDYQASLIGE